MIYANIVQRLNYCDGLHRRHKRAISMIHLTLRRTQYDNTTLDLQGANYPIARKTRIVRITKLESSAMHIIPHGWHSWGENGQCCWSIKQSSLATQALLPLEKIHTRTIPIRSNLRHSGQDVFPFEFWPLTAL